MPKTLLLADDSVTIQKVVGITFANEDIELVTVDNGNDALSRAKQIVPDLILADIGMPGMDGYELCATIRRYPALAHVPVLLLTGTFESYDEARAKSVGASGHISKPFEAQALVDRVWALLAESEAQQGATRVADPLALGAAPAAAPAPPPAPQPDPADDPFADLPELPNSNFSEGRATASGGRARLPEPRPSDLFDLEPSRPPLAAPLELEEIPAGGRSSQHSPWRSAVPEPSADETRNGETAFLDPLQDLTPPPARAEPAAAPSERLLPPAEAPDFLDLGTLDPQEDTNPTYADGSSIGHEEADLALRVRSGESLAVIVPDATLPPTPDEGDEADLELAPLPEIDPIDLEPLEAPDPQQDATLRANLPPEPVPAADPSTSNAALATTAPLGGEPLAAPRTLDEVALRSALEKVAWEAFGSLSQELVDQFTRRLEAILWDVVPAIAERLVREEIARLKSEP
jgi:CheY-like chemotaxis protein